MNLSEYLAKKLLIIDSWLQNMKLVEKIFDAQRSPPAVIIHICRKNNKSNVLESSKNQISVSDIVKSCMTNLIVLKITDEVIKKPLKVCVILNFDKYDIKDVVLVYFS